jgi:hypothetical protein
VKINKDMITKANFFIIIILVLIGVIVVQQCTSKGDSDKPLVNVDGKNYELLKQKTDTVIIDHYKTKYVKGEDIYHETIVEKDHEIKVPVYIKADSERIIKEYHAKVLYKDKLVLDNNLGTIEITDTISMNKIIGRKWNAQVRERTITDTKIVKELPRNQVYAGLGGVVGNSNVLVGPQLTLKTKKDNIYGLNMYLDNNLNKYIGFNIAWKIKLKK